ncbi:MAG TPA: Ig-like domain-containing protein [Phycisphaerae bacterium]|nr:Ig-like domain-containing protein [Phycisphaerae bacterium]
MAMKVAMVAMGVVLVGAASLALAADQEKVISVETMPPVVVKTVPEAGSLEVDPSTTEIRATFSKDMMDGDWSFVQSTPKENYPETTGKPHYLEDHRTIVLPVKLAANRTYVVWLNSGKFSSFMDTGTRRAVPYLLVFKTKS